MLKKTSMHMNPKKRFLLTSFLIIKYVLAWIALIVCFLLIGICVYSFFGGKSIKDYTGDKVNKTELGEELITAMYNFESPYQLDAQMLIVQELTTEDVYNDLTIDNEERTITTYLKFKDSGVSVEIISSGEDYVYYRLISDAIESNRTFIMFFSVNEEGLINWVKEAECVEFIDTIY